MKMTERKRLLHDQWIRRVKNRALVEQNPVLFPLFATHADQVKIRDAVRRDGFVADIVKFQGVVALEVSMPPAVH